jgi:hypothetical protein
MDGPGYDKNHSGQGSNNLLSWVSIKKALFIKTLPITIAKVFVILSSSDAKFAKI